MQEKHQKMKKLSPKLLEKLSTKLNKKPKYVREQISKRANRYNMSSEAAMVIWAKSLKIGVSHYVNSLPAYIQSEIRSSDLYRPQLPVLIRPINQLPRKITKRRLLENGWIQLAIGFVVMAVIGGAFSQIVGGYLTNLLGITRP